jgi:hypothetical protein
MEGVDPELLDELGQRIVDEEFVDALLRFDVELRIPVHAPRRLVVHAFAEDARMVLESLCCRDEVVQPSHHLLWRIFKTISVTEGKQPLTARVGFNESEYLS